MRRLVQWELALKSMRGMAKNYIRIDSFERDGKHHTIWIKRTGNELPQPARINVSFLYWDETGGLKSQESKVMYDRVFEDWNYAHAVYDEILRCGSNKGRNWND